MPSEVVRAISAFLDFCYLVRRDVITEETLADIDAALRRFWKEREVFRIPGVRFEGFSLPRQHSLKHYPHLIREFGAPNGLCSSITESKHIKAVKQPWRRTNKFRALKQMLLINQRLDKLAAIRVDFEARGMLEGPCARVPDFVLEEVASQGMPEDQAFLMPSQSQQTALNDVREDEARAAESEDADGEAADGLEDIEAEVTLAKIPSALCFALVSPVADMHQVRGLPRNVLALSRVLQVPQLPLLIRRFLYQQFNPGYDADVVAEDEYPTFVGSVSVYPSAVTTYYAPSDHSGTRGMRRERIRAVASWRGLAPRRDCVFVDNGSGLPGFRGLHAARVLALMSVKYNGVRYPCALVTWFSPVYDEPDVDTGMWIVEPDTDRRTGQRVMDVIHLDTILRCAHLIGVAGTDFIPRELRYYHTYDAFKAFYVNKYADHHSHTIAS